MELEEIRILKEKAEEDVREILIGFMESTNITVIGIEIGTLELEMKGGTFTRVNLGGVEFQVRID